MKRSICFVMVCLLSLLTACSGNGAASDKQQEVDSAVAVSSASTADLEDGKISKDPLKLKIFMHQMNNAYDANWPIWKKAAEITNISLEGTVAKTATDPAQEFNLMIAKKDIPDIVVYTAAEINQYGQEGAFLALDDLIKKDAPNIDKYFSENPEIKKQVAAPDGKIYRIPVIFEGAVASTWTIRQDWLDKLNLKTPTTVQEYHDVLKAFLEKDPNGNGKQDEVPYFSRSQQQGITDLLWLYGCRAGFYADDNGKIQFGQYSAEYKNAIKNIAQWYKEGLIDKEIFTRGGKARDILFGDNVGGSTHDWVTSTSSYNVSLADKIPGFSLVTIAPPANINGVIKEIGARETIGNNGWAISAGTKYPDEVMKYFDFWFSEQGRMLNNYGILGEDYTLVNGVPTYTDKILKSGNPLNMTMWSIGGSYEIGQTLMLSAEMSTMTPQAAAGVKMYDENKYCLSRLPTLSYNTEELNTITNKNSAIDTYWQETMQSWIFSPDKIDAEFDKYISTLKGMGMDEVIAAMQSAYDRMK
ncbi:extracellular solute-binding protein [Anaerocolumna sp. MB42-C2]|uniref:extracellular solute-binding protein n=1 Tax=Anaerocolumna sp. MB42-C2 TaxID=3070997 RepID=UPI0027E1AEA3|nr:extracellular solute-binding protein [Anaerocolumna sp. MB42-C2]WMJ85842.1 extracellular solute-binding protein [Anaerocolumna sp. MB42-C2]